MPDKPETKSSKFVNYTKGAVNIATALGALVALGLSIFTLVRKPPEPAAAQSYVSMEKVVKQLSDDIIKEHDSRMQMDAAIAKDLAKLQGSVEILTEWWKNRAAKPVVVVKGGAAASQPVTIGDLQKLLKEPPTTLKLQKAASRPAARRLPPMKF